MKRTTDQGISGITGITGMSPDERAKATIMVVDDTPENLRLLAGALSDRGYNVRAFPGGELALKAAAREVPDLLLLDINMPGQNGYQVCDAFKAHPLLGDVPILFISAAQDTKAKLLAFRHGGLDYVTKPFRLEEVFARVETHLELKWLRDALADHNTRLSQTVAEQVREISDAQVSTIVALAKLAESRDDDTGTHIERMSIFSRILAKGLRGRIPDPQLDDAFIEIIDKAAALHDIGKVGIPDSILLKPGKLTDEEFDTMKTHTVIGFDTLATVLETYPGNHMIRLGAEVARSHHEKWNGSGYPDGLAGEAIPLCARIVAVADAYDAMRSRRPYKAPFSHDKAVALVKESRGQHFDPDVVDAFLVCERELDATWSALQG